MEITSSSLQKFVAGQIEAHYIMENLIYRGKIKSITLKDKRIHVIFIWLATGKGSPPIYEEWTKNPDEKFYFDISFYKPSDAGNERILFAPSMPFETILLIPSDQTEFDPEKKDLEFKESFGIHKEKSTNKILDFTKQGKKLYSKEGLTLLRETDQEVISRAVQDDPAIINDLNVAISGSVDPHFRRKLLMSMAE